MLRALIKTMRPHQWHKNAFVFIALVFDLKFFQPGPLLRTVLAFLLFCLMSSAVYIMNDIVDRDKDRLHPTKRNRPIPAGRLPVSVALGAAVALTVVSLPLGFLLDSGFGWVLVGYGVLQVAYTFRLKHMVILDVMAVAAGFVLRVAGGVFVVDVVRFSPWLYVFTTFAALLMSIGKRRHELLLLEGEAQGHRRILDDYSLRLLDEMLVLMTAAMLMSYSLYTFSAPNLPENHGMMLTIPFMIYFLFRYLYLIHVRGEGGAPDELVFRDRPLLVCLVLWAAAIALILYVG